MPSSHQGSKGEAFDSMAPAPLPLRIPLQDGQHRVEITLAR